MVVVAYVGYVGFYLRFVVVVVAVAPLIPPPLHHPQRGTASATHKGLSILSTPVFQVFQFHCGIPWNSLKSGKPPLFSVLILRTEF